MKNYTQVYVKNSFEAAEVYCKAFGAEITREFKNENNMSYDHCELSVDGEGFWRQPKPQILVIQTQYTSTNGKP